ncbi:MAG: DUF4190 domain-containing protein [Microbacteriaceae bacterium]|nr:DUF4190 domain-containing protein [Microbacteriaceae bacterium]
MPGVRNNFRLVASVLFFVVAAASLYVKTFRALLDYSVVYGGQLAIIQVVSADLIIFPLTAALGLIGIMQGRDKLFMWGSLAVWFYCVPLVWFSVISLQGIDTLFSAPVETLLGYQFPDQAITLGLTAASALAFISSQQKQTEASPVPSSNSYQGQSIDSPMPILALVGAFVFPIFGIVLGHIALAQMSSGKISSRQRGLALAGLFIGYAFLLVVGLAILWLFWFFSQFPHY